MVDPSTSSVSPVNGTTPAKRKYVTRACDACKKRKWKCNGENPCSRCVNANISCSYDSSYKRGNKRNKLDTTARHHVSDDVTSHGMDTENHGLVNERLEDDADDASVHGFLRRVSGHLAIAGQGLPRSIFKREEEPSNNANEGEVFILPDKAFAKDCMDSYFEHASITYRFLPRLKIMETLEKVYSEDEEVLKDPTTMAIILLAMAVGCIWLASWRNQPMEPYKSKAYRLLQAAQSRMDQFRAVFPPTLGMIQAHFIKCQLEVAARKFNSAWMTLGTAIRLGQMIEFQKEAELPQDPLERHCSRGLFWAIFTVDRYLASSLGRPLTMRHKDVTIAIPSEVDPRIIPHVGTQETKIIVGQTAHSRLCIITGYAISRLYSGKIDDAKRQDIIDDLEGQLEDWLQKTPPFFHPVYRLPETEPHETVYDIQWVFRRQQTVVRSAFYFTNMLIYRGNLLREFLNSAPNQPRSMSPSAQTKQCVVNALAMTRLATDIANETNHNAAFWTTSYFVFCAISVLLVYMTLYRDSEDRAIIESAVERAMKDHRRMDNSVNLSVQKLLEESHSTVHNIRRNQPAEARIDPNQVSQLSNQNTGQNTVHDSESWQNRSLDESNFPLESQNPFPWVYTDNFEDLGMILDIGFDNTVAPNFLS